MFDEVRYIRDAGCVCTFTVAPVFERRGIEEEKEGVYIQIYKVRMHIALSLSLFLSRCTPRQFSVSKLGAFGEFWRALSCNSSQEGRGEGYEPRDPPPGSGSSRICLCRGRGYGFSHFSPPRWFLESRMRRRRRGIDRQTDRRGWEREDERVRAGLEEEGQVVRIPLENRLEFTLTNSARLVINRCRSLSNIRLPYYLCYLLSCNRCESRSFFFAAACQLSLGKLARAKLRAFFTSVSGVFIAHATELCFSTNARFLNVAPRVRTVSKCIWKK